MYFPESEGPALEINRVLEEDKISSGLDNLIHFKLGGGTPIASQLIINELPLLTLNSVLGNSLMDGGISTLMLNFLVIRPI